MRRKSESGQALVFTALALVVLLGFAGLAIDMGTLRYQKRLQQSAADAAAIAGASNLGVGGVTAGAQNAAATNGFTDTAGGQTSTCTASGATIGTVCVQVNNPPASGPHSGNGNYVEVLVADVQPTYFMKIFGTNSEAITARAVATNLSGGAGGGGGCIYTLGTPQKKIAGVGVSGSVILNAPTCGIADNGNLDANGGSQLSITAGSIGVAGTYNPPGSPNATISPTPLTGMPYSGDPFANAYSAPAVGAPNGSLSAPPNKTTTFTQGTYSSITLNNNSTSIFSSGVYVVDGGSFTINGKATVCGGGTITATNPFTCAYGGGVTFYLTNGASLTTNGTPTVQMYAPNSGTYEGLLFYEDPNDTQAASLSGDSSSFYQGAIYMPSAQLTFGGNASFNNGADYTIIVVDELQLSGNPDVNLKSNYSGLSNGGGPLVGAITSATLVE